MAVDHGRSGIALVRDHRQEFFGSEKRDFCSLCREPLITSNRGFTLLADAAMLPLAHRRQRLHQPVFRCRMAGASAWIDGFVWAVGARELIGRIRLALELSDPKKMEKRG